MLSVLLEDSQTEETWYQPGHCYNYYIIWNQRKGVLQSPPFRQIKDERLRDKKKIRQICFHSSSKFWRAVIATLHIQNKSVLLKASFNYKKQQEKGSLLNKIGAATIGYSVGNKLDPPPHMPFAKIFQVDQRSQGKNKENLNNIYIGSRQGSCPQATQNPLGKVQEI